MTGYLLVVSIGNLVLAAMVVWQSRMIAGLAKDNRLLVAALHSMFVEAVWPAPGEGETHD